MLTETVPVPTEPVDHAGDFVAADQRRREVDGLSLSLRGNEQDKEACNCQRKCTSHLDHSFVAPGTSNGASPGRKQDTAPARTRGKCGPSRRIPGFALRKGYGRRKGLRYRPLHRFPWRMGVSLRRWRSGAPMRQMLVRRTVSLEGRRRFSRLTGPDCEVHESLGEADAIRRLRARAFDVIVTSPTTAGIARSRVVAEAREQQPGIRTIVIAPELTADDIIAALTQRRLLVLRHAGAADRAARVDCAGA